MHIQTITKSINLHEGWKDDNFQGLHDYTKDVVKADKAIGALFRNPELEVVSVNTVISINVRAREKEDSPELTDDFWLQVATGRYSE